MSVDDIVLLQMANYGLKLYGSAIIVNSKFAADRPEAVKGFLHAFTKGLKETIRSLFAAVDLVLELDDAKKKEVELERLRMLEPRQHCHAGSAGQWPCGGLRERLEVLITMISGSLLPIKPSQKPTNSSKRPTRPPAAERRVN